jgi:hypothetical protein
MNLCIWLISLLLNCVWFQLFCFAQAASKRRNYGLYSLLVTNALLTTPQTDEDRPTYA